MQSSHFNPLGPSERAQPTNLLGGLGQGTSAPRSAAGRGGIEAQLFETEVERAISREGGREAVEQERSANFRARRSARHGEFSRYQEGARSSRSSTERRSERDEPTAERVPIDTTQRQAPIETGRGTGSGYQAREASPGRPTPQENSTNAGGRSPNQAQPELSDSAGLGAAGGGSLSGSLAGQSAAQGATVAPQEIAGVRATGARPAGGPGEGVQAFLGTERTKGSASVARTPSAAGHTPDPELIEQAEKVLRQIRLNLRPGARQITINLDPVELGRLSIDLRVDSGRVSAIVRAESPETLELLRKQAPELRAMLAQQGFETDQLDLQLGFESGARGQDAEARKTASALRNVVRTTEQPPSIEEARPTRNTDRLDESGVNTLA